MIIEYNGGKLNDDTLLYFYASWTSKCNIHLDALKRINNEVGNLLITKINVTKYQMLKQKYLVKKIPTFIILKNDEIVARLDGYKDQYSLLKWINNYRS